ncbi:hypothetical protein [Ruegeria arenilitoris]|uniref:hypothetical protein n=1 Tax=Ruegeria arenilitoris TaxID=1173585 RepID=UPI001479D6F3|nr:hypothetical protein [Ruegeria arenilitoris]
MTLTFPIFGISGLLGVFRTNVVKPATKSTPEHELAYEERAFLRELIARNPEALENEQAVMAMMTQYPRSF